jgi:hypothetical protein
MSHDPSVVLERVAKSTQSVASCITRSLRHLIRVAIAVFLGAGISWGGEPPVAVGEPLAQSVEAGELTEAAERALTLLETASAGSAEQRTCFTCHSQAHPVLAIVEARRRGFHIDEANLARQVRHTAEHLNRGRQDYLQGRGQGGKADTAGYALWTLESGDFDDQETTGPVVAWLLGQQRAAGNWQRSSDRPPSEASHFATTYIALKGIRDFATAEHFAAAVPAVASEPAAPPEEGLPAEQTSPSEKTSPSGKTTPSEQAAPSEQPDAAEEAATADPSAAGNDDVAPGSVPSESRHPVGEYLRRARDWLGATAAADTEDRVFRLLSLHLVEAPESAIASAARELLASQREDGGWSQLDTLASDAYATGTALFALQRTGHLAVDAPAYLRGLDYLLQSQHDDGSWHVASRSRPFQTYYETGFPHGKDQFISTSATAWATLAILLAHPEQATVQPSP